MYKLFKKAIALISAAAVTVTLLTSLLAVEVSAESTVATINYSSYSFAAAGNGSYFRTNNVSLSSDQKYNGYKSLKIDNTGKDNDDVSFLVLANGSTSTNRPYGYRYIVTVKYKVVNASGSAATNSAIYASFGAKNNFWGSYVMSQKVILDDSKDSADWGTLSFPVDTTSCTSNGAFFLAVIGMPDAKIYIAETKFIRLSSTESVIAINSTGMGLPDYIVGTIGKTASLPTPTYSGGSFLGYYTTGDGAFTSGTTQVSTPDDKVPDYAKITNAVFTEKPYIATPKFKENVVTEDFEDYYFDHSMDIYNSYSSMDDDYELYKGTASNIYSGKTSLHRIGNNGLLSNIVLLSEDNPLYTGDIYTMTMRVKMDKYAQENGAIKIISGKSPSYSWATPLSTGHNVSGDTYLAVVPIADLKLGDFKTVSFTFKAAAPYVILQTPGYCSLYIDCIEFTHKNSGTALSATPSYTEYKQVKLDNPQYKECNENPNLSFENYTYSSSDRNVYSDNYSVTSTCNTGASALKFSYTKGDNPSSTERDMFRLKKLQNEKTYKITFDYLASSLPTAVNVNFATACDNSIYESENLYKSEGESFKIEPENADGKWHKGTVYLSSSLKAAVTNNTYTNDNSKATKTFGEMLYCYLTEENDETLTLILDSFEISEVENFVTTMGAADLLSENALSLGHQAMRFYFSYPSANGINASFDGSDYTVRERGILVANGKNSSYSIDANGNYTVDTPSLNSEKILYATKKNIGLSSAWARTNSKTVFTTYIKGFSLNDSRDYFVRAYTVLSGADGKKYTLYSTVKTESVSDINEKVEINTASADYHHIASSTSTLDKYKVIVPNVTSYFVTDSADKVCDYFKKYSSSASSRNTDYAVSASSTSYEILIGDTDRSETAAAKQKLGSGANDYVIYVPSKYKLVICGNSDLAVTAGVDALLSKFKKYDAYTRGYEFSIGYTEKGSYSVNDDRYQLTFGDEFSGSSVDTSKWGRYNNFTYSQTSASTGGIYASKGGHYIYCQPDDQNISLTTKNGTSVKSYSVSGGKLNCNAFLKSNIDFVGEYFSTFDTMMFKYGVYEIKAKLPGAPISTSIWLNGGNLLNTADALSWHDVAKTGRDSYLEIDILEDFANSGYFASNLHRWIHTAGPNSAGHTSFDYPSDYNKTIYPERILGNKNMPSYILSQKGLSSNLHEDYHIYTLVWTKDYIKFALDGRVYMTYDYTENTNTAMMRQLMYPIISCSFTSDESIFDNYKSSLKDYYTLSIDYVRLYQVPNTDEIVFKN